MLEKLKLFLANDSHFYALVVLLVGVASFGLGKQSVLSENNLKNKPEAAGVVFYEASQTDSIGVSKQLVASKSGTRYHLLSCPGAVQIKEENKIFFDSVEKAKAAGYEPAANCLGL